MNETNNNMPYVARLCGLFVRDRSELALVDVCGGSQLDINNKYLKDELILFMASLGKSDVDKSNLTYASEENNRIKMGRARNGSTILIDFRGRKRFIRINLDDNQGISITLQVRSNI